MTKRRRFYERLTFSKPKSNIELAHKELRRVLDTAVHSSINIQAYGDACSALGYLTLCAKLAVPEEKEENDNRI